MNELEIMAENGVLDRAYRQKFEKYLEWGEMDFFDSKSWNVPPFSWATYPETTRSEASRAHNT